VGAAISSNFPDMAKGVKLISALMEVEHDDRLLDATRRLCNIFSDQKQQMMMLHQSKTVNECALQLIYAAKKAGGNPKVKKILFYSFFVL
jgi:hypothetical protein